MAIGLAASMIIPSGVPQQILWASEFSAESSEMVADVFGDNSESELGNRTGDKNNEKYEFDTSAAAKAAESSTDNNKNNTDHSSGGLTIEDEGRELPGKLYPSEGGIALG